MHYNIIFVDFFPYMCTERHTIHNIAYPKLKITSLELNVITFNKATPVDGQRPYWWFKLSTIVTILQWRYHCQKNIGPEHKPTYTHTCVYLLLCVRSDRATSKDSINITYPRCILPYQTDKIGLTGNVIPIHLALGHYAIKYRVGCIDWKLGQIM